MIWWSKSWVKDFRTITTIFDDATPKQISFSDVKNFHWSLCNIPEEDINVSEHHKKLQVRATMTYLMEREVEDKLVQ